ncbi:MAG: YhdH/YhfP family quinone oxidoreductase [Xanthomonadales bacterium]|nr:YhdH/YhfP family quinone oxidoreductase [Xanthomonadales bacterium]
MSSVPSSFNAFRINHDDDGHHAAITSMSTDELSPGDVIIRVLWSSINYKDALAGTGKGKILRQFPLNGGIDSAGVVVHSESDKFKVGDEVLVTGCGQSETRDGGYSEYLRVESQWAVPKPTGLTLRECMGLGTAGFTAALSLQRMEDAGQTPDMGPIVVTGATGGVGSIAISLLHTAGYEVHAISGKTDQFDWLQSLGASQCVAREGLWLGDRPMESARWAGAIDNVGSEMLASLTRVIKPWGNIASCGLAAGIDLRTTVMPFIIRGIGLLGINSAGCPYHIRSNLWTKLANEWKPRHLEQLMTREATMEELPEIFEHMLKGGSLGRTVVKMGDA